MKILYEDKDQIVIHKPAGVATQTARLGEMDLVSEVKNHIAKEEGKANPFVGVINRLDQPVEGIVLFAKNQKSATALSKQMQDGSMQKYYLAAVFGQLPKEADTLTDYLEKDARTNTSRVVSGASKDAKKATLEYNVMAVSDKMQFVRIHLLTGRHHQIRVQFSHRGNPLVGDSKYGSAESMAHSREVNAKTPALCAYKLMWKHPITGKEMDVSIAPEHPVLRAFYETVEQS